MAALLKAFLHVRAHIAMLRVAWSEGDKRELSGQLKRIVPAALFSRIWVPSGNTGLGPLRRRASGATVHACERRP